MFFFFFHDFQNVLIISLMYIVTTIWVKMRILEETAEQNIQYMWGNVENYQDTFFIR